MKRKIAIVIGLVLAVGLLVAMILPPLTATSNCGGNSYALSVCSSFILSAKMSGLNNHSRFEIAKIEKDEKESLSLLAKGGWGINGTDFYVKTKIDFASNSNTVIVVVCKRQFGNVPQPTLWNFYHENPAHAVGFSDGTTGLVSPEQFRNLNLAGFVSLSNLVVRLDSTTFKP